MHINCRSISKNFDDILNLLHPVTTLPTVLAVTETWLTEDTQNLFQIPGYNFITQSRLTKGGGVGLFICHNLTYMVRNDLCHNLPHIECLFIELSQNGNHNILLGCIYRPPNTDPTLFNSTILDILKCTDDKGYKTIAIAGDFNLDLIKSNTHTPTSEFMHNLLTYSFLPAINIPTRITNHSKTLIDNIFVHSKNPTTKAVVINCDLSDHLPIAVHVNTKMNHRKPVNTIIRRDYTLESLSNFNSDLSNSEIWKDIYDCKDTNSAFNKFQDIYMFFLKKHFPIKKVKLSHKHSPRHEWMTRGLINSCNKKAKLYKKYITSGSSIDKLIYTHYLNDLKKLLRAAEKTYYANKFHSISGNLRKTWTLINTLISKNNNDDTTATPF